MTATADDISKWLRREVHRIGFGVRRDARTLLEQIARVIDSGVDLNTFDFTIDRSEPEPLPMLYLTGSVRATLMDLGNNLAEFQSATRMGKLRDGTRIHIVLAETRADAEQLADREYSGYKLSHEPNIYCVEVARTRIRP